MHIGGINFTLGKLFESLDLNNLHNLERIYCFNNLLKSLDLDNITSLLLLNCEDNQLKSLELKLLKLYKICMLNYRHL